MAAIFSQRQPALPVESYVQRVARGILFFQFICDMLGHATSWDRRGTSIKPTPHIHTSYFRPYVDKQNVTHAANSTAKFHSGKRRRVTETDR